MSIYKKKNLNPFDIFLSIYYLLYIGFKNSISHMSFNSSEIIILKIKITYKNKERQIFIIAPIIIL